MPALMPTMRTVSSCNMGMSSRMRWMLRSSGPRTASTMQNSDAPRAAVSWAAARTSVVSRKGVALTGVWNCADWEQKWQSSGHPPVLADRIPSISTSGPHQASRTWWAREARAITAPSGMAASAVNSSAVRRRRSSRRACSAVAITALSAALRATWGGGGGSAAAEAERKATGLVVVTAPTVVAGCGPPEVGRSTGRSGHGLGFLDRARVRGEAGVDAGLRARGGVPARDAGPDLRPSAGRHPAAAGAGQGPGAVGGAPPAGARRDGVRAGAAGVDARDLGAVAAGTGGVRQQRAGLGERGVAGRGDGDERGRVAPGAVAAAAPGWGSALGILHDRARHRWI